MADLFPPIQPYDQGLHDVGGGHQLYWEVCGSPAGTPAVVLHGGPGSGCSEGLRRFFDPAAFRIVLFDQRNCGRSRPHASDASVDLSTNTTPHLIADIEALRELLGVERWLVFGSSWGSVLGLAYAQTHPERVSALVISHASASRHADIHWLYHGVGRYFPEAWSRFRDAAGPDAGDDLIAAYHRRLNSADPAIRDQAAKDWCAWEDAVISIDPRHPPSPRYQDPRFRTAFARIVTHYFVHRCWLDDGQLLRDAHRLANTPGAIIGGRLDLGTPVGGLFELAKAWPAAELTIVENAGHETATLGMREAMLAAIQRFARA